MEACWKPGRSHETDEEDGRAGPGGIHGDVSPSRRHRARGRHGAAGQRPGPGSSGGLRVQSRVPATQIPALPRPLRPSPGGRGDGGGGGGWEERPGGLGGRCGREGPLWAGVAREGPRSAPAGRARGCRAVRAEPGSARRAGGGERGGSAAGSQGPPAAPGPLQLCSKLGLAAATRRAGSRSSPSPPPPPPSRTTTNSVASARLGACSPGRRQAAAAPQGRLGERLCSRLRVDSGRWYLPFPAPASGPVDRSPSVASPGARKPLAARTPTPGVGLSEQPRSLAGVTAFPQRPGVCSRPSGSHAKATSL